MRHAVEVLPWTAVRVVNDATADDLGFALVPWPIELGDEIAVAGDPWPSTSSTLCGRLRVQVAAILKVRTAVLPAV